MPAVLSQELLDGFASLKFEHAGHVNIFFYQRYGKRFPAWFNTIKIGKPAIDHIAAVDNQNNDYLADLFWNHIPIMWGRPASLVEVIALSTIILNETGGNYSPRTELIGTVGHPGLSYCFDRIPGLKRSYNTLATNRTCLDLFNDPTYFQAHKERALADRFAMTKNQAWAGEIWPAGVPTDPHGDGAGWLSEADFYKFRGRGFIQTTGRANYMQLIKWVQEWEGVDAILYLLKSRWTGLSPDAIASTTTNEEMNLLFGNTGGVIPAVAVALHNFASGHYLGLSPNFYELISLGAGSLYQMGFRISGSVVYASNFAGRVRAILESL